MTRNHWGNRLLGAGCALAVTATLGIGAAGCDSGNDTASDTTSQTKETNVYDRDENDAEVALATTNEERLEIETRLNLRNIASQTWTYNASADAWVMSPVTTVIHPEIEDEQGVSIAVPGAYVKGIHRYSAAESSTDNSSSSASASGSTASNSASAADSSSATASASGDATSSDNASSSSASASADSGSSSKSAGQQVATNLSVDVTAADDEATAGVAGTLVIDYDATVTSTNGQTYTAATAPIIFNTGAAGYSSQTNANASTEYAAEGYVNVQPGNRGKQDTVTDADGNTTYTGDAPLCLIDQKNAARFVRYNIALGNLPGNAERLVSTGGSGGGAHATMFAATSDHFDFYAYQAEAGAVGVYKNASKGSGYTTTVTIDGSAVAIADGAWGTVAYSPITSLAEADEAMAFEYYLDADYSFGSDFQKELAGLLAADYMELVNSRNLTVSESAIGVDIDGDGTLSDKEIALTIEHDGDDSSGSDTVSSSDDTSSPDNSSGTSSTASSAGEASGTGDHSATNGYYGTYLDLYLAKFEQQLQWMIDNLDYASDWTWFSSSGDALSDEEVAAMTAADRATAFVEGRYSGTMTSSTAAAGTTDGAPGDLAGGTLPDASGLPDGDLPDGLPGDLAGGTGIAGAGLNGMGDFVGTPDEGTTQSATGATDSANYDSFADMLAAYQADVESVEAGDTYGNNIVELYNPLNYIGAAGTSDPTWVRLVSGAAEGDISMFNSLNLELAFLAAGTATDVEWQWDGGHVPSEILGESLPLTVDTMIGQYGYADSNDDSGDDSTVEAVAVTKPAASARTTNGDATSQTGTDLSSWVTVGDDGAVSFALADIAAYRTAGASKAIPGFDVIDYGQEDYVFGNSSQDARHWDRRLLDVLTANQSALESLFNK
ncbi:hypothetical protein [Bifidobacterium choloepi]|uniref:Esterase n=1 Tax=Bifidobacterium choloepi TaxID=2614131 RepID=A0A6I5NP01_9BIFI|nr:hypothetical protein [Bifidobacterium choloepi]NEG70432.1 hypothetical protein [Bifidobacterium choloepi]